VAGVAEEASLGSSDSTSPHDVQKALRIACLLQKNHLFRARSRAYTEPHNGKRVEIRMDYSQIITIDPDKRSGKPCIRGTAHYCVRRSGLLGRRNDVTRKFWPTFPDLTETDIRACLAFAADAERRFEILSL
jgi:uncharacterized protein (DUF433 family)